MEGVGLATFLLLPAWGSVLNLQSRDISWISIADFLVTTGAVALLYVGWSAWRGWKGSTAGTVLAVMVLTCCYDSLDFVYNSLRGELLFRGILDQYKVVLRLLSWTAAATLMALFFLNRQRYVGIAKGLCELMSFVFLVLTVQIFLAKIQPVPASEPAVAATSPGPRVVVLVFDEMDAGLLKEWREHLPAFRRIYQRAAIAGESYPPSNYTHLSLPAMLTGRPLASSEVAGGTIMLTSRGAAYRERLDSVENLIGVAAGSGRNVSLIGWHLPYCQIFPSLSRCIDDARYMAAGTRTRVLEWLFLKN